MEKQDTMFQTLEQINQRPKPFEFYTAADLWTDDHTSEQMLACHLNPDIDLSSRKGEFIDRSAAWIASHFNISDGAKIADFGCGPGLYTTRLAKHRAQVTGIDFSPRSIEYAQQVAAQEHLNIQYYYENYLDFESADRFDLIIMIMCDFCALSPAQRRQLLTKFHQLLLPNGAILLDVYSLNAFELREEVASYSLNQLNGFWSPRNYFGFLNTFKYEEEKVVLDKYTIIEADRTRTVYNWLQYFSRESLEKELRESGFNTESIHTDVAGTPFDKTTNEYAVISRKE